MTKIDIIQDVYEKLGFSKKDSAQIVESVFEIMKDSLARGEKIKISGFGNFSIKEKKSRRGRNPQTGDEIEISARKVLTFKSSGKFNFAANSKIIKASLVKSLVWCLVLGQEILTCKPTLVAKRLK